MSFFPSPLPGREQFHGLGSMYCRGATAIILTYDVNHPQSLVELEDRFLSLTDTASTDCLFAIVGNKVDLREKGAAESQEKEGCSPGLAGAGCASPKVPKQVQHEERRRHLYLQVSPQMRDTFLSQSASPH